jgi:TolB-like protein
MRALLAIAVLATTAHADDAPTFAVQLRSWDAIADKMTYAFADELRAAGRAKNAAYRAKGTHKDFVAANTEPCVVTELACAGAIGERLAVDYVLVGEVETRGKRFVLTMNVVDVKTKKRVRSLRDVVDRSSNARKWAKRMYIRVVDAETGELAITSNVPRAVVWIDGQKVTELFESRATLMGLSIGPHKLELRAPGFRPYIDEVIVDGRTKLSVLLEPE